MSGGHITHGEALRARTTPEFCAWENIIQRCCNSKNPAYKNYGGRGIGIADDWRHDYARFLKDVGRRPSDLHSIDRIDNERGYEPGNVRWALKSEQVRNTRRTRFITFDGLTLPFKDWSRRLGIDNTTVLRRIRHGWPVEEAFKRKNSQGKRIASIIAFLALAPFANSALIDPYSHPNLPPQLAPPYTLPVPLPSLLMGFPQLDYSGSNGNTCFLTPYSPQRHDVCAGPAAPVFIYPELPFQPLPTPYPLPLPQPQPNPEPSQVPEPGSLLLSGLGLLLLAEFGWRRK